MADLDYVIPESIQSERDMLRAKILLEEASREPDNPYLARELGTIPTHMQLAAQGGSRTNEFGDTPYIPTGKPKVNEHGDMAYEPNKAIAQTTNEHGDTPYTGQPSVAPQSSTMGNVWDRAKGGLIAASDFAGMVPGSVAAGFNAIGAGARAGIGNLMGEKNDVGEVVSQAAQAGMRAFQPSTYMNLNPEEQRGHQAASEVFNLPAEAGAMGLKGASLLGLPVLSRILDSGQYVLNSMVDAGKLSPEEQKQFISKLQDLESKMKDPMYSDEYLEFAKQMMENPETAPFWSAALETAGMVPGYGAFPAIMKRLTGDTSRPLGVPETGKEPTLDPNGQIGKQSPIEIIGGKEEPAIKTEAEAQQPEGQVEPKQPSQEVTPQEPEGQKEPVVPEDPEEAKRRAEEDFKRQQDITYTGETIGYDRLNKRRKSAPEAPNLTIESPEELKARLAEHKDTAADINDSIDFLTTEDPFAANGRVAIQNLTELKEKLGEYGIYTGEIVEGMHGDKVMKTTMNKIKAQIDKINTLLQDRLMKTAQGVFVKGEDLARTKAVQAQEPKWIREITEEKEKLVNLGDQLRERVNQKYGDFYNAPLPDMVKSQKFDLSGQTGGLNPKLFRDLGDRFKRGWAAMMEDRSTPFNPKGSEGFADTLKYGLAAAKENPQPNVYRSGREINKGFGGKQSGAIDLNTFKEGLEKQNSAKVLPFSGPGGSQGGAVINPWDRKEPTLYDKETERLNAEKVKSDAADLARLAHANLGQQQVNPENTLGKDLSKLTGAKPTPAERPSPASDSVIGKIADKVGMKQELDKLTQALEIGKNWTFKQLIPLAAGPDWTGGVLKTFSNKLQTASYAKARLMDMLKNVSKEDNEAIYRARQQDELAEKTGIPTKEGVASLPENLRQLHDVIQNDYIDALQEAQSTGVMVGGYENYTPRRLIAMFSDGTVKEMAEVLRKDIIGGVFGPKKSMSGLQSRKYLTAQESEAAARETFGDNVSIARDIRTLPIATAELRRVSATKVLLENIRKYGNENFVKTVENSLEDVPRGWMTVNHPAFKNVWIHPDFYPQIESILNSKNSGGLLGALMTIKAKSMGLLIFNPLTHNSVIYSKAAPFDPISVLTGYAYMKGAALRGSPLSDWMFTPYNAARGLIGKEPLQRANAEEGWAYQKDAMEHGFRPPDRKAANMEVSDLYTPTKEGQSWTAQLVGQAARLFNKKIEAMNAVDTAGEFWHGSMLWNRITDLGMFVYDKAWREMVEDGMHPDSAKNIAGLIANRYMGTTPIEAMSQGLRTTMNLTLFSRQFNTTNAAIWKDALMGLPPEIRGQLKMLGRESDIALGNNYLKRKQRIALLTDIVVMNVAVSAIVQSVIAASKKDGEFWSNLGKEGKAYGERMTDWMERMGKDPTAFLDPKLTPQARNETGKEEHIYLGNDTNRTGEYVLNPGGKVGRDLVQMFSHPLDFIQSKESQFIKLLAGNNYKGGILWGNKDLFGPNNETMNFFQKVGVVAKHVADSFLPGTSLQDASEWMKGNPNEIHKMKALGSLSGVLSFSKGFPGGPDKGVLYQNEKSDEFKFAQDKPLIDHLLDRDKYDEAETLFMSHGKTQTEFNAYMRKHYNMDLEPKEESINKLFRKDKDNVVKRLEETNNY